MKDESAVLSGPNGLLLLFDFSFWNILSTSHTYKPFLLVIKSTTVCYENPSLYFVDLINTYFSWFFWIITWHIAELISPIPQCQVVTVIISCFQGNLGLEQQNSCRPSGKIKLMSISPCLFMMLSMQKSFIILCMTSTLYKTRHTFDSWECLGHLGG